ncbi:MAG TPA: BlaI/MecI/CopY family transcriptional regulator [Pyrinomonadaceae bacterium]|jgi:predicted transcriptional regulator
MPKRDAPRPTDAELEILNVLWQRGACTVRDVQQAISRAKPAVGYTTVLKLMQIMAEKGLVERDETERAHVYEARLAREQTQRQLIGDLLERAFEGSATKLVMQALSAKKASAEELTTIREMLDEFERGES